MAAGLHHRGFTLTETLLVILLLAMMAVRGLSGWRDYRQALRLEQSGRQLLDFLARQQQRANLENRSLKLWAKDGKAGCLGVQDEAEPRCEPGLSRFLPPYDGTALSHQFSNDAGFFGVRNTAQAGHVQLSNGAGSVRVVWSGQGRLRLCAQARRLLSIAVC
ncbi:prepilin-type N-terminal cleavage/methylation domain-containing protein [Enterobacillus tribolii]|uniref:Prepilin peptidase dependent protein A n=1 Tax=Enterobacillus tribolii TaxID=1487935 RepID=A0A370QPV7_9GAMM|nr:prepilin-type N-terminal cleavage/methylation domain-containing protein [Enterobacillus tribolii]MBW7981423.1 prepilin-type N-terminal cleavage/methylation domain-containing protein [Enterobacillus tribolii]RDK90799.1 prepilin peptidase dependent protein A [Enterobacillus tribolii]